MSDDPAVKALVDAMEKRFDLLDRRVKHIEEIVKEIRESQARGEGPQVRLLKDHVSDLRRAQIAITEMAEKIKSGPM